MVFTLTLTTATGSSSCSCSTSMGCGHGMKRDISGEGCGRQRGSGGKGLRVGEKNGEFGGKKSVGASSVRRDDDDASSSKCVRSVTDGGTNKVHRKTYSGVPRKTYTKLQATFGLFICVLHLIGCAAAGSPLNIWNYLPIQKRSLLSQDKIKRFAAPSRVSDYWTFVSHVAPSFDNSYPKNITTQLGQTVYLHCVVNNLGDKTVSWIRRRDFHVLTVGLDTYTTDDRFEAIHMERNNDWTLKIKFAQLKDAGLYECQVSSDPKISLFVNLSVVVAKAEILGPHPLFVKTGSSINLTCVITKSPEPPVFVFWYHDDRMINYDYDSSRGEITIQKTTGDSAVSRLYIKDAQADDSGNYTCCPSNTEATSISVYVLNGERPAAIQHDANISRSSSTTPRFSVCILLVLSAFITR